MRFVSFRKTRTGSLPEELVFDTKLTTHSNFHKLEKVGIRFITLRRRPRELLEELSGASVSVWRRIKLHGVSREYPTPRVPDQTIAINGHASPIRQIAITNLRHQEPTLLLINQIRWTPKALVERYAERMFIETGIANGVDSYHMGAPSSVVAMKVSFDLQLTLMGSSLYRHTFRDLIDATAHVRVTEEAVIVRLGKRAHNSLLFEAGFAKTDVPVPWWGGCRLRLEIGEASN